MRARVMHVAPELGRFLQPKCGEFRMGYCDEEYAAWEACPIGRKRPHKRELFELYNAYRRGELDDLDQDDFTLIEEQQIDFIGRRLEGEGLRRAQGFGQEFPVPGHGELVFADDGGAGESELDGAVFLGADFQR